MRDGYKRWVPGNPITVNRIIWGRDQEFEYVKEVFEADWFGPGKFNKEFQEKLSEYIGMKYCQLVNSGSSALLLATQALMHTGRWKPGDKILHPVCTFPTSCNSILQSGMELVMVDVEPGTYQIDIELAREAMRQYPEIRGAVVPHLLGNITDMDGLMHVLGSKPLVEDCCDTFGGTWDGEPVGTFGDFSCFSFYGSHHITTAGVGGAIFSNRESDHRIVRSMVMWGREKTDQNTSTVQQFERRYSYDTIGYDFQMCDIQAAFGLAQLKRINAIVKNRALQFNAVDKFMQQYSDYFVLPVAKEKANPSWFGYPLQIKPEAPFTRRQIVKQLLDNKIEIRPLFTGNITRHKAYRNAKITVVGGTKQADLNMDQAFFIPAWGHMEKDEMDFVLNVIHDFMEEYG